MTRSFTPAPTRKLRFSGPFLRTGGSPRAAFCSTPSLGYSTLSPNEPLSLIRSLFSGHCWKVEFAKAPNDCGGILFSFASFLRFVVMKTMLQQPNIKVQNQDFRSEVRHIPPQNKTAGELSFSGGLKR